MVQGDVTMALLFTVCFEAVSSAGCGQAEADCNLLQAQMTQLGTIAQLTQ